MKKCFQQNSRGDDLLSKLYSIIKSSPNSDVFATKITADAKPPVVDVRPPLIFF